MTRCLLSELRTKRPHRVSRLSDGRGKMVRGDRSSFLLRFSFTGRIRRCLRLEFFGDYMWCLGDRNESVGSSPQ